MSTPYLEFKYLKNRNIDLGNGEQYDIPYRMGPKMLPDNVTPDPQCVTPVPIFDLDKIHKVELLDETPDLPEKVPNMPERLYEELCADGWRIAGENRKKNDSIRKRVQVYVKSGSIAVVSDPFSITKTKAYKQEHTNFVSDEGPSPLASAVPVAPIPPIETKPVAPVTPVKSETPSDKGPTK